LIAYLGTNEKLLSNMLSEYFKIRVSYISIGKEPRLLEGMSIHVSRRNLQLGDEL